MIEEEEEEKRDALQIHFFVTYKLGPTFYWPTQLERSYVICGVDVAAGCQQQMDDRDVAVSHCQVERSLLVLRAEKEEKFDNKNQST